MIERPILFSAPMVRALLAGWKTQTRRLLKVETKDAPEEWRTDGQGNWYGVNKLATSRGLGVPATEFFACPYGQPGDRLWVRETWAEIVPGYIFRASNAEHNEGQRWKPSIFMPRQASRITLELMEIWVERLQNISEKDAKAEGVDLDCEPDDWRDYITCGSTETAKDSFRSLWDSINAKRAPWESNPWIWVLTFRVLS